MNNTYDFYNDLYDIDCDDEYNERSGYDDYDEYDEYDDFGRYDDYDPYYCPEDIDYDNLDQLLCDEWYGPGDSVHVNHLYDDWDPYDM